MILVTGGTGFLGSHLLYFLLQKGYKIRAVHRKVSQFEEVKQVFSFYSTSPNELFDKIDWVEANLLDIPALTPAFHDITHVYHVAAYISFDPKHYNKLKKANIEGTANVVNLSLQNNVEKFCHVSSIATLGNALNGEMITESTSWNPEEDNSVYAITKYGAEMEVWRASQEGLNVSIVKPSVILGSGHWNSGSGLIVRSAAKGMKYYTSGGVGVVDVIDVVKAMIKIMRSDKSNQAYLLSGENILYKDLLEKLAIQFGEKPPKKKVSKLLLDVLRRMDWVMSKLFGSRRKLLRSTVNSMFKQSFYDSSKIQDDLNFHFTPIDDTIKRLVADYQRES